MEFLDEDHKVATETSSVDAGDDDDSIMSYNPSSSGAGLSNQEDEERSNSNRDQLFKAETQVIFRLRLLVLTLLMIFAMIVSIGVFVVTFEANTTKFLDEYEARAQLLIDSFENDVVRHVEALAITTHEGNWPFETLPNFQQQMTKARHNTGILSVSVAPLVTEYEFG